MRLPPSWITAGPERVLVSAEVRYSWQGTRSDVCPKAEKGDSSGIMHEVGMRMCSRTSHIGPCHIG
ncbi:hypothetical protein BDZ91DRAFT_743204 [Kalaharituber pfeilii]|nr:hypothetical protein BDZ91DRAFT_743204 [Kalaharituber pfeilii]